MLKHLISDIMTLTKKCRDNLTYSYYCHPPGEIIKTVLSSAISLIQLSIIYLVPTVCGSILKCSNPKDHCGGGAKKLFAGQEERRV